MNIKDDQFIMFNFHDRSYWRKNDDISVFIKAEDLILKD